MVGLKQDDWPILQFTNFNKMVSTPFEPNNEFDIKKFKNSDIF